MSSRVSNATFIYLATAALCAKLALVAAVFAGAAFAIAIAILAVIVLALFVLNGRLRRPDRSRG